MNSFAFYICERFFYGIGDFLRRWYVSGGKKYGNFIIDVLETMDRIFAWKMNAVNMFKPLYKDYSVIGYVVGFPIRLVRLIITLAIYAVVILIAAGVYLIWLFAPIYVVWNIFK
ncbi:hypothetical protein A3I34_00865 [Candidatus Jorgensenbacteria bacterium RIFCSPLOWO2_02_FULL_45_12]|uniref:Phage shock protein PspC N-terminal domain-containing protein n=2 Tax=Candidatus Joergenseniibacteriota TaxID=1752739 RepID=A0A1F6BPP8_9BACT|nr:MAG: hypothetical protein UX22_C0020G0014 [Candidatus Jorgensenbacteria bacterium GW2011_GWA2_45_9]OGG38507.1 MAG: hypothetical protein A3D55_02275 [Candidatus Jorgensenbacteria bacterium RIFCSPHIGHO2_02_FULL_45_20]OGG42448.1 MAG: hypothetical protein A3I34_00865 [Candidatus Jorgensenbacteria bacterium RIFCSPLOWO2_02_FULL_45_12]